MYEIAFLACVYKMFLHTEAYSLFHSPSFNKTRSHKQQKMSNKKK